MDLARILDVEDELDLYLAQQGQRPAAIVNIRPLYVERFQPIIRAERIENGVPLTILAIPSGIIEEFTASINRKIHFKGDVNAIPVENYSGMLLERHFFVDFYVSATAEGLERVLAAKDKSELGLALGYPPEAVKAFGQVIAGERRDGNYWAESLAKARRAGIDLPTWLAYISHVPEVLDIVGGNVSQISEAMGLRYQEFVRRTNPQLAARVEGEFRERKFEDREKLPDGSYMTSVILKITF